NSKDVAAANAVTFGGLTLAGTQAGNYTLTAQGNAAATITAANLTVTANNAGKTYDGVAYRGGNGVAYLGLLGSDTATALSGTLAYSGTSQGAVNTGSYVITPGGLTSGNYTVSYVNGALTITKAPLTVTANNAGKPYDGVAYSGGNGVAYAGFVGTESATALSGTLAYSGTSQGALNAGSYAIAPVGLTSGNYSVSYVNGTLTINPTLVSAISLSGSRVYDGTLNVAAGVFTLKGLVAGQDLSLSGVGTMADKNVGANKLVALGSLALGNGSTGLASNYTLSGGTVTITPAPLAVTANNAGKPYDGVAYSGGNGVAYAGFVGTESAAVLGGTLAYSGTSQGALNAGSYAIAPVGLTSGNYSVSYVNGTLTINPTLVSAISLSGSRVYDGTLNVAAGVFTLKGLVAGQDLSLSGVGTMADKNVGANKPVALGSLALGNGSTGLASNYTLSGGTVTITPAPLAIQADPQYKVFAEIDPLLGYSTSGLVGGDRLNDTLSGSLTRSVGEASGLYGIGLGSLVSVGGNYSLAFTPASLRIVPRVQSSGAGVDAASVAGAETAPPVAAFHASQQEDMERMTPQRRPLAIVLIDEGMRLPAGLAPY
ncbi:MAG: hypothetical protein HHJ12_13440, partial [Glaciimonas sp.]|nr:hypothetical protein [Glaciimonas sp.]